MDRQDKSQRDIFDQFVREVYIVGDHKKSKTITNEKGKSIIDALSKNPAENHCPKFKHWIKQRGFSLMNYGALGLKDVLCLPARKKVCIRYYIPGHCIKHLFVHITERE